MLRHLLTLFLLLYSLPQAQATTYSEQEPLTAEEQAWLAAHPTIRLGIDPDWAPFEYLDEQQRYRGMAADYIALIADRLGLKMEPVKGLTWSGVLEAARQQRLDLLPAATQTVQRDEFLNFTAPYLDFPMVIITRAEAPFIAELAALKGQRVAVVNSYASHELLAANHPTLALTPFTTIRDGLSALSTGEVDAFVGNLASATHAIHQLGLTNLKVAAHTPYSFKLGMGVRKDWPELATILDKTLRTLEHDKVNQIREKWIGLQPEAGIEPAKLFMIATPIALASLLILIVILRSNHKLRTEIVERHQIEKRLLLSEEALNQSQRTAHIGWWHWDLANNKLSWSDEVYAITGKDMSSFTPTPENFMSVVHAEDLPLLSADIQAVMQGKGEEYSREFRVMREDGTIRYVHSYGKIYGSAIDQSRYFAGVLHDITERRQSEEKLRRQAYSDELTNLPNRNYFMEQLAKTLAQSRRHDYFSALLFFDLDNFKIINDTLGHHTGDKLLADVGMRLRKVIRKEDTAARLGGDEFVIIVTNLGSDPQYAADQARQIAEKLHHALAMPFSMAGHEHHLTMSTGISLFPFDSEDINDILKFADTAMYRAKETGRNAICFFQPSMQQAAEERFALQGKMRQALTHEEFELYYQPQFNSDGKIIGAESLLRWQQPELGMVSPARFIPLAEESGMILDIGIWVLREACRQVTAWQQLGIDIETLAVNVSPRQFHQPDFVAQVQAIIRESGINPHCLELELTEGVLVENIFDVTQKMEQLRQMGLRFAIDDFGTGYSSLRYLKQLPLDRLKIDQSFVRDIHQSEANALLVETIISMAHHLGLELIAEGVETLEELKFLELRGCHKFQGYYFSRPLPAPQLTAKLQSLKQTITEIAP